MKNGKQESDYEENWNSELKVKEREEKERTWVRTQTNNETIKGRESRDVREGKREKTGLEEEGGSSRQESKGMMDEKRGGAGVRKAVMSL